MLSSRGGLRLPDPPTKGFTPGPHWGLSPQTPIIGSRSRARHNEMILLHQTAPIVLYVSFICIHPHASTYICTNTYVHTHARTHSYVHNYNYTHITHLHIYKYYMNTT